MSTYVTLCQSRSRCTSPRATAVLPRPTLSRRTAPAPTATRSQPHGSRAPPLGTGASPPTTTPTSSTCPSYLLGLRWPFLTCSCCVAPLLSCCPCSCRAVPASILLPLLLSCCHSVFLLFYWPCSLVPRSSCSYPAPILLLSCSYHAPILLLSCSYPAPILLLSCSPVTLLLSCSYPALILLLSCSYPALILLLSCWPPSFRPDPILLARFLCL